MDQTPAVDPEDAARWMAETADEIARWMDPGPHTLLPLYLGRADVRRARGEAPAEVLAELAAAGRCWGAHAGLLLDRLPVHRLRTRRLVPLEMAITLGEPALLDAAREHVAMDPVRVLAGTEPSELTAELDALIGGRLEEPHRDLTDAAARLALLWWAGLSAVVRGDRDVVRVVVAHAAGPAEAVADRPEAAQGGLARLLALHAGLRALATGDEEAWRDATLAHARLWDAEAGRRRAAALPEEGPAAGALDLASLALVALALAFGVDAAAGLRSAADDPYGPALAGYAEALAG